MSSIMNIDDEYRHWIEKLTLKYRNSQIKAAIKVNVELLAFYWSLGRDIVICSHKANGEVNYLKMSAKT